MRKLPVLSVLLAFLSLAAHASARGGMPEPTTGRGQIIEGIYFNIFVAGVIVFLIVMALLVWVMARYRASSGVGRATFERERENLKLELTWIIIPLAVVLWVGGISYAGLVELDEGTLVDDAHTQIRIIGSQWNWEANYGAGVSVFADPDPNTGEVGDDNVFVFPAGVPIAFNVTAIDVIHSFAIQEYDAQRDRLGTQIGMVDANPNGPHRFNHMVVEFEEGEYRVQCKEMCFNPGHAYMRARIQAVPLEEYGSWLEQKRLEAGADLIERVGLQVTNDGDLTTEREELTFINGARLIVQVANDADQNVTVSVPGSNASVTIDANDFGTLVYDTVEAGNFSFEASTGGRIDFAVVDAELVEFELGDFYIDPPDMTLEAGVTYLFQATNVGGTIHNLFVGDFANGGSEVFWNSITVGPGNTASFIVTPEEPMRFDTWCNVPGHHDLGMFGVLTVE